MTREISSRSIRRRRSSSFRYFTEQSPREGDCDANLRIGFAIMRSLHRPALTALTLSLSLTAFGCVGSTPNAASAQGANAPPTAHRVFELVAPSVVAIMND